MTKTISIVVPAHQEEKNIPLFYRTLVKVLDKIKIYEFEIIFVDDGSQDATFGQIAKLAKSDARVKYIQFSRNFGKEMATTAGLNHSTGDAVMMIDADLQHPPKHIPEFLDKWERGAEIVIGVRNGNNGEGLIKKLGSVVFYRLIRLIAETKIVPQATDFRLLDRCVVEAFNKFTERNRITRGLIDWLGFQKDYVYFESPARTNGNSPYSTSKLVKLALSSFITHSLLPLKLAGYAGVIIIATSGPLGLFIIIERYILSDPLGMNFTGPAMLAVFTLFLVGIVLSCLGLIALYIANIHGEVINRPMYIMRKNNFTKL